MPRKVRLVALVDGKVETFDMYPDHVVNKLVQLSTDHVTVEVRVEEITDDQPADLEEISVAGWFTK